MKLSFYGADQCVTGSCHCLEVGGKHILIDCGLQQGRDEIDNASLPFHPGQIDYVLVTHAHIDHSGRIPLLIKQGFQGRILTTRLTADLLDIMLQDSAHIQESDAEYKNRKNQRAGRPMEEPLYTVEDAMRVRELSWIPASTAQQIHICDGVDAVFIDAGHLLGSASIRLTLHRGRRDEDHRLFRRYRQRGSAHHPEPPVLHRGRLCGDGEYLRQPQPHGGVELYRSAGPDHRRDTGPGRQRGDPRLRRGPHPGAAVLYPGDQG